MNTLDDDALLALDSSEMFVRIGELGTELIRAWEGAVELQLPPGAAGVSNMVIAGMGGSATAGDYFAALCLQSSELPIAVVQNYSLPNYVSDRTFVVVSSYSGNTEEAINAYDDAWKRGASLLVVTRGGMLAERARIDSVPVHGITYDSLPRAAVSHSLAPLMRLGLQLGICPTEDEEIRAAGLGHRSLVESSLQPAVKSSRNPAKRLAAAVKDRIPLVLGAEHLAPVAVRFKNQLAENGKSLAAVERLPEADHNLIVGLETAGVTASRAMALITLESKLYDARTRRRFGVTCEQFERAGIPVHRLEIEGTSILDQLLVGTAWGDYVSCYLALLAGIDPSPIRQIDEVKAALAQSELRRR